MTTSKAIAAAVDHAPLLDDVVTTLVSLETMITQLQAVRASLMATAARIADDEPEVTDAGSQELAYRAVATEIGASLHVSDRTIEQQMHDAVLLARRLPETARRFAEGRVSAAHVRVLLDAGAEIETDAGREAFEAEALPIAEAESPNRLRAQARQIAERHRERSFRERHDEVRAKRGVWVREVGDGESELWLRGPSVLIHGAHDRLTRMAQAIAEDERAAARAAEPESIEDAGRAGEHDDDFARERTRNQVRADLALDLLLSGSPQGHNTADELLSAISAQVEVTVPVLTLMRTPDESLPAHLEGVGPIDPVTAALLAAEAPGWDRVLTDPVTGTMMAVDRYRPSAEMRRHLRARDRRCRFMTCRIRAMHCDDDHTHDHAHGGATCIDNLAALCRRHHTAKHHTAWRVRQIGRGELEWTSPTGRVHVDRPPAAVGAVRFRDLGDLGAVRRVDGKLPAPF